MTPKLFVLYRIFLLFYYFLAIEPIDLLIRIYDTVQHVTGKTGIVLRSVRYCSV